jgi:subtilisin family serine protease
MRRVISVLAAASLLTAVAHLGTASAAATPNLSKFSPAMADLYQRGGYGTFPIQLVVSDYQPGTVYYLAKVSGPINGATLAAIRGAGATVRFTFPQIGYVALVSSLASVAGVSLLPQVTFLEIDRIHDILGITARTAATAATFADQSKRGTHDIGADVLWSSGISGKGVTVGVADSGIDSTHPDLGYKIANFVDCTAVAPTVVAGNAGSCVARPGTDDNGHGSHVSGIAAGGAKGGTAAQAGLFPGVAPEATLAGAKVCLPSGSCLNSSVMAGLVYLATEKAQGGAGADVINISLGSGRFYFSPAEGAELVTNNDAEAQLVNQLAVADNVVFTISAGNSGPVLGSTGSPAVASQVIAVGASITDFDLNHPVEQTQHGELGNVRPEASAAGAAGIAQFSSRGPTGDRLIKPELTAPGVYYIAAQSAEGGEVAAADVAHRHNFSTDPFYAVLSGTSMSSPAAAGAAALVWDGYKQFTGQDPLYYRIKAALANTAGTRAFEGSVVGLISGIRAKNLGDDPEALFPLRNRDWVGVTGEGAGRIYAPAAVLAITQGVLVYTPQVGAVDNVHELQPNWALDDVAAGESRTQSFVLHGGPGLVKGVKATFAVESGREPTGMNAAPAKWFILPGGVGASRNADSTFQVKLAVPSSAKPGTYAARIIGTVKLGKATQKVTIPVQFFVPVKDANSAQGTGTSLEGPIWASEATDYSVIGFENPEADIFTDWTLLPLRLPEGTKQVDLGVYDVEGKDHMDVFVFDSGGREIDSTVTPYLDHAVPNGALYSPTGKDSPNTVSILDGNDLQQLVLPTTVWIAVSDSGPDVAGFSTYHLDVDVSGGGGGTTPADRIHSGQHAFWSGSQDAADSTLTEAIAVPSNASQLRFWTWYTLEDGYDWAYVLVSTDNGQTWTSLATTSAAGAGTTDLDPIGDSGGTLGGSKRFPNGFTGVSGSPATFAGQQALDAVYDEQTADLSPYAGQSILLRFAYTSDPSTSWDGFYVDDVSIVDGSGAALLTDSMETQGAWQPGGAPGFAFVTAQS